MRIAVFVHCVPDTAATPEIGGDGRSILSDRLEQLLDPYDEYAVEEAVRMKEGLGAEVVVIAIGDEFARKALRSAFAMGIEAGVMIRLPDDAAITARGRSLCLAQALRDLAPDLVLTGKQSVDCDEAQVAERVAELLGFAHASAVTCIDVVDAGLVVEREVEGGHLTVEITLPAVVTTAKGINVPRYPSLPQVLKAKSRPVRELLPPFAVDDMAAGWVVEGIEVPQVARERKIFTADDQVGIAMLTEVLRQ